MGIATLRVVRTTAQKLSTYHRNTMKIISISCLIVMALAIADSMPQKGRRNKGPRTCEKPGSLLRRGTPRYAPKYGCCNELNISEKLEDGEEAIADQNIVGDFIIAGGNINGHNYYLGKDNEMSIWWMEDFNGKGPMWVIGKPQNVGATQNFAFGSGIEQCMDKASANETEGIAWKGKDYEGQQSPLYLKMKCGFGAEEEEEEVVVDDAE